MISMRVHLPPFFGIKNLWIMIIKRKSAPPEYRSQAFRQKPGGKKHKKRPCRVFQRESDQIRARR
jgi:hypothetical protein